MLFTHDVRAFASCCNSELHFWGKLWCVSICVGLLYWVNGCVFGVTARVYGCDCVLFECDCVLFECDDGILYGFDDDLFIGVCGFRV
jgi:hypothetical protein